MVAQPDAEPLTDPPQSAPIDGNGAVITLRGDTAAWPFMGSGQEPQTMRRIGVLLSLAAVKLAIYVRG